MRSFVCFLSFLILTACDSFLDTDLNKSQITTNKVFGNDVTATAAVTAIYNTISNNSAISGTSNGMIALAGLSAGELYNYRLESELIAFQQHQINAQNLNILLLWNCIYNVVYQANAVLEGINRSSALSNNMSQQLRGEALFIRAFAYFYLVNLFGDVPLAIQTDYHKNQNLPRRSADDVYAMMESDLLSAQMLLSNEYVTPQRVRPNRATATALLARLYLYKQQYAKAEVQATLIIDDLTYQLTNKDDINNTFLIDSKETIWQLMSVVPYANTMEGYNFIITSTPRYQVITDALKMHFEAGDLRAINWMSSYTNSIGTFYFPYKYKQMAKEPAAPFAECSIVFRLAEIYLIRAEARSYLDDISGAQSDLNAIRARAGLSDVEGSDRLGLLQAIEGERWSELFTEYGHRWFDLKRTSKAIDVLGNGVTSDDLLYPLPASEFIRNPNLGAQNHGY